MVLGKQKFLNKRAFSMLELLTAVTLMVVLAIIGIKNYQSQINKSYKAEAQQSLSFVYNYERIFFSHWNSYHENLMIVGVNPESNYNYDVGFTSEGHTTGGKLKKYPVEAGFLQKEECSSFKGICEKKCVSSISRSTGFFTPPDCEVKDSGIKDCGSCGTATAEVDKFKAIAVKHFGKGSPDIWSINQNQTITHEKDGT
ncbi:MAG: hypothetical protein GDA46_00345 [Bdellovibrionales bacterium]|nr:hypothetical protein [Bdellovibrionales bacterium]